MAGARPVILPFGSSSSLAVSHTGATLSVPAGTGIPACDSNQPPSSVSASGTATANEPATRKTSNPSARLAPAPSSASGTQARVSPASSSARQSVFFHASSLVWTTAWGSARSRKIRAVVSTSRSRACAPTDSAWPTGVSRLVLVLGLAAVEHALERVEVMLPVRLAAVLRPTYGLDRQVDDRLRNGLQLLAGPHRVELHLRGALEVIEHVIGFRDGFPHGQHAVVRHEHRLFPAEHARKTLSFLRIERRAGVEVVVHEVIEQAALGLADRLDLRVLEPRERRSVRHVRMHHADCFRNQPVDRRMDAISRALGFALTLQDLAGVADLEKATRGNFRPVQAERDLQVAIAPARDRARQVIENSFGESVVVRDAMRGGEIHTHAPFGAVGPRVAVALCGLWRYELHERLTGMCLALLDQRFGCVGDRVPLFRIMAVEQRHSAPVAQVTQHRHGVRHLAGVVRVARKNRPVEVLPGIACVGRQHELAPPALPDPKRLVPCRMAGRGQEDDRAVAEEVVLAIHQLVVERMVPVLRVVATEFRARHVHFGALHEEPGARKRRVTAAMVEVEVRRDDEVNVVRLHTQAGKLTHDVFAWLRADREEARHALAQAR